MVQYLMAYMNARRDEEGQGLVEYALIIALVAVASIGALQLLTGDIGTAFSNISSALTTT
ncbi:MAG: Flp family type IVb pilin [Thermomicrobiales bacterium]